MDGNGQFRFLCESSKVCFGFSKGENNMYQRLNSKAAVVKAIAEYDQMGKEAFLKKYGFGPATHYHLLYKGKHYDSKAIVGRAYRIQFGESLTAGDFGGGKKTVVPKLRSLGFQVVADEIKESLVVLPEEAEAKHFWEGARQTVVVNRYERSADARAKCIQHYKAVCFICGFDFGECYGDNFMGFIHVHHIVPLAAKKSTYKVNPKRDLRPVCANCHAVIHCGGKTRTIEEMKALIQKKGKPDIG